MTTITIQPGSIKHKVLEAILELEKAATGAAIRKRHPSNEHLVGIAIEHLSSDGLIQITSEGNYELTAAAKKAIRGQSVTGAIVAVAQQRKAPVYAPPPAPKPAPPPPPAPAPAAAPAVIAATPVRQPRWQDRIPEEPKAPPADTKVSAPQFPVDATRIVDCAQPTRPPPAAAPAPTTAPLTAPVTVPVQRTEEPATVAKLINCTECETDKPRSEYYIVNGEPLKKCKRCVLDRQKAAKESRDKKAAPKAKRAAKAAGAVRSVPLARAGDFVIPAAGQITCRASGLSYEIGQGESRVVASLEQQFSVVWHDSGRDPRCPPNPQFPEGIDLNVQGNAPKGCTVMLPYPAKRCGVYHVVCKVCGLSIGVTTAGRPDDPRSLTVACQMRPGIVN